MDLLNLKLQQLDVVTIFNVHDKLSISGLVAN